LFEPQAACSIPAVKHGGYFGDPSGNGKTHKDIGEREKWMELIVQINPGEKRGWVLEDDSDSNSAMTCITLQ